MAVQAGKEVIVDFLEAISYDLDETLRSVNNALINIPSVLPFKEGDRVSLNVEIDFKASPGWAPYKHFLYQGSPATIRYIEAYIDRFIYFVVFDDDTAERKSCFLFKEDEIEHMEEKKRTLRFDRRSIWK